MNLPKYDIIFDKDPYTFNFISEGKNGTIQKVVFYQEIEPVGVFNLAFGFTLPVAVAAVFNTVLRSMKK